MVRKNCPNFIDPEVILIFFRSFDPSFRPNSYFFCTNQTAFGVNKANYFKFICATPTIPRVAGRFGSPHLFGFQTVVPIVFIVLLSFFGCGFFRTVNGCFFVHSSHKGICFYHPWVGPNMIVNQWLNWFGVLLQARFFSFQVTLVSLFTRAPEVLSPQSPIAPATSRHRGSKRKRNGDTLNPTCSNADVQSSANINNLFDQQLYKN